MHRFARHIAISISALALCLLAVPVVAQDEEATGVPRTIGERVEADLTTHTVAVEADFAGAHVILFGSVVGAAAINEREAPDVVIVIRGPHVALNVQRKRQIAGIWANSALTKFENVPGYYAVVAAKPVDKIASSYTLLDLGIGLDSLKADLVLSTAGFANPDASSFAEAVVRIMTGLELYDSQIGGISFAGRHLFRAEFALPSNVPIGDFTADIFLFREGVLVGQTKSKLKIEKSGLERIIYNSAHNQPFLYGILSVLAAIAAGLAAAAAFGRK